MSKKLLHGFNHVATISPDLDRLIDFYRVVFGSKVVFDLHAPGLERRHAGIEVGDQVFLHAWELPHENVTAAGDEMFRRGRLDHMALAVDDEDTLLEIRDRLVAIGAANISLTDFGNQLSVWFTDPDGMGLEVCCWKPGATWADARDPQPIGS